MLNSFLALVVSGRVDQLGMIATLASSRSRVQIPSRPPELFSEETSQKKGTIAVSFIFGLFWALNYLL